MKKLLLKFGYIPQSSVEDIRTRLSVQQAVNAELREIIEEKDERIVVLIDDCARHREAHDSLKQKHEQQQRAASISAKTFAGFAPKLMNGIRR